MREKETITAADVGEVRIVEGVAIAVSSDRPGRAAAIEKAMADAVTAEIAKAAETGAPFPSDDVLRAATLAARERVKAELDGPTG